MTWVTSCALLFILASSALAGGTVRCTTYHEATLNRWHTLCADGTRGLSTWNSTLGRWDTTMSPPPGKQGCTGTMNPRTQQLDVHCR